jgi:sialic acid synthase SpsE
MESSSQVRRPYVVAEIGGNHRGSVETAKEMIMIAAQFCKANVVKFQKRTHRECREPCSMIGSSSLLQFTGQCIEVT